MRQRCVRSNVLFITWLGLVTGNPAAGWRRWRRPAQWQRQADAHDVVGRGAGGVYVLRHADRLGAQAAALRARAGGLPFQLPVH